MKINELEKIVNDGLVKYKAFKDADDVLNQVKGLDQAKTDLGKVVSGLEKQRASLLDETSKINDKLNLAEKQAAEIIASAEKAKAEIIAKAEFHAKSLVDAANSDVSKQKHILEKTKAETKLAQDTLSGLESSLDAAQKEWAATQAKFKAVVGG